MQVKRSKHMSAFVVMPNAILQHSGLSLTARGLLGLLLSQPDQTAETVKTLTADVTEGGVRVTKAMKELQAAGYVAVVNVQNERGHFSKHVTVYDTPQTDGPKDETPKPVKSKSRFSGLEPLRGKNQGKNPPAPEVSDVTAEAATDEGGIASKSNDEKTGQAAGVLSRLGSAAPAMTLKASEVIKLAPLAAEWLARGATELQIRNELTEGLPPKVKSAAALVENRLVRKMPPVPVVAVPLADCAECANPLPRGQQAGICGRCAGVAPVAAAPIVADDKSAEAASLLDQIRQRRASGAFARGAKSRFMTA
ncbi:hypothetical protein [Actinacidiphila oryziradicis]|uniref:hypothetical protein n=1 Tax=Actinacidiphila oryziradicis TaxID=2571141 RepID=UPI0023F338E0|nr:hypothetical protein [Actinacidiphila oryziradicis]MCW2875489.1 hypothetical protein [Actinacidiphila oryziradicis]